MSLQNLDVLLAYSVVMLLLSLLIMILLQALSTMLNQRGTNLLWGIERLLTTTLKDENGLTLATKARDIAQTDYDGAARMLMAAPQDVGRQASEQKAKAALNAAQKALDDETAKATLASNANAIARAVLTHPTISHGEEAKAKASPDEMWSRAAAIRKSELLLILQDLGRRSAPLLTADVQAALRKVFGEGNAAMDSVVATVKELDAAKGQELEKLLANASGQVSAGATAVATWFDAMMDRTTEQFHKWTRTWTIVLAFIVAIALQLDTLHLLHTLSTNGDVRAALVASATTALKETEKSLASAEAEKRAASVILNEVIASLDDAMKAQLQKAMTAEGQTVTRVTAAAFLKKSVNDDVRYPEIQKKYDALAAEHDRKYLDVLQSSSRDVQKVLLDSGLQLVPDDWFAAWTKNGPVLVHLLGIFVSALLLSLGAPFWFNALRSLSSLRPILAGKVDEAAKES